MRSVVSRVAHGTSFDIVDIMTQFVNEMPIDDLALAFTVLHVRTGNSTVRAGRPSTIVNSFLKEFQTDAHSSFPEP